jgi:cell division septation protein DedD
MRKMLQQRFLGFFVLLLLFVAGMVFVSKKVQHYPNNGPLRQSVQSAVMPSEVPAATDASGIEPPDDLAVIAMMATESDTAVPVPSASTHAITLDQPISHHTAKAIPSKIQARTSTNQLAWRLQVASFASQSNAKQLQQALHKGGWSVTMVSGKHASGHAYYRLYVGPFTSIKRADKARQAIKQAFNVLGFIVKGSA